MANPLFMNVFRLLFDKEHDDITLILYVNDKKFSNEYHDKLAFFCKNNSIEHNINRENSSVFTPTIQDIENIINYDIRLSAEQLGEALLHFIESVFNDEINVPVPSYCVPIIDKIKKIYTYKEISRIKTAISYLPAKFLRDIYESYLNIILNKVTEEHSDLLTLYTFGFDLIKNIYLLAKTQSSYQKICVISSDYSNTVLLRDVIKSLNTIKICQVKNVERVPLDRYLKKIDNRKLFSFAIKLLFMFLVIMFIFGKNEVYGLLFFVISLFILRYIGINV